MELGDLGDSGKRKGEKRKGTPLVMLRKNSASPQTSGMPVPGTTATIPVILSAYQVLYN
jgi:hypothetical protein